MFFDENIDCPSSFVLETLGPVANSVPSTKGALVIIVKLEKLKS